MNEELWHKIFKKYLDDYYAIHKLNKDGIVEFEHMQTLLSKLLDDIMTTFDSEINKQNFKEVDMGDCCKDCPYHYELTEEQKNQPYDGSCGCTSLENTGRCWKADQEEYDQNF